MRLTEKYRPMALNQVCGQSAVVRHLRTYALEPYPARFLFEGEPGTGKTSTGLALAGELEIMDVCRQTVPASELTIDECRRLFDGQYRLRLPREWGRWQILLVEELELLPSKNVLPYLKQRWSDEWFSEHYRNLIVVATTNDASALDPALLERMRYFRFDGGRFFAEACSCRLEGIWAAERHGEDMPFGWQSWGWVGKRFSMRRALQELENQLRTMGVAAG